MSNGIEIEGMVFDAGMQTARAAADRVVAPELIWTTLPSTVL